MPHLHQKAGGSRMPPTAETVAKRLHYVHQEGAAVYKFAVARMAEISMELMLRNKLNPDKVDWLVPHQANKRIIEATAERMGLPMDRVMVTINKFGNTTAATIPLCLWDYEPRLKTGDRMIFAAFGGGFTWAGAYVTWGYDGALELHSSLVRKRGPVFARDDRFRNAEHCSPKRLSLTRAHRGRGAGIVWGWLVFRIGAARADILQSGPLAPGCARVRAGQSNAR